MNEPLKLLFCEPVMTLSWSSYSNNKFIQKQQLLGSVLELYIALRKVPRSKFLEQLHISLNDILNLLKLIVGCYNL